MSLRVKTTSQFSTSAPFPVPPIQSTKSIPFLVDQGHRWQQPIPLAHWIRSLFTSRWVLHICCRILPSRDVKCQCVSKRNHFVDQGPGFENLPSGRIGCWLCQNLSAIPPLAKLAPHLHIPRFAWRNDKHFANRRNGGVRRGRLYFKRTIERV